MPPKTAGSEDDVRCGSRLLEWLKKPKPKSALKTDACGASKDGASSSYTYSKHKGAAGVVAGRAALSVQDDCVPVQDVCERVVRVCVQHRCGMRRVIAWDRGGAVQCDRDRVSVSWLNSSRERYETS